MSADSSDNITPRMRRLLGMATDADADPSAPEITPQMKRLLDAGEPNPDDYAHIMIVNGQLKITPFKDLPPEMQESMIMSVGRVPGSERLAWCFQADLLQKLQNQ